MKLEQPFYIEKRTLSENHLDLNGKWDFCYCDNATQNPDELSFEYSDNLPSATYFNVYNAGILPHPYQGNNCYEYRFVDQKVWYYRRKFSLQEHKNLGKAFLCFEGVGYYSRVWLNGIEIGEHEGLFGGPIVEIAQHLRFGEENELIVEVKSCNYGIPDEEWKGIHRSRTKPYVIPWNMVKDSITSNACFSIMGIFRDIRIEFLPALHISRPYLTTENIEKDSAQLHLSLEIIPEELDELKVLLYEPVGVGYMFGYSKGVDIVYTDVSVDIECNIIEKSSGRTAFSKTYNQTLYDSSKIGIDPKYSEAQFLEQDITIENPLLWYPQGLGAPELYTVEITLYHNGKRLDYHTFDYGIRTFKFEKTDGIRMRTRWGKYKAVINGKPFFVKGMNWMPLDVLLNLTDNDYRWALELAKDENIQLIRVWGAGNSPEQEIFYKLCDELGILVWQDSFICTGNSNWDKNVFTAQQCMYLYRIRNHPSLVVHCGGNELNPYDHENHCIWIWQHSVEDIDPSREMIRSTPDKGGAHIYRNFEPSWFRKMFKQLAFVGESGIHTFPSAKSLRQCVSADEFNKPIEHFGSEKMFETHSEIANRIAEKGESWSMLNKVPTMSHICKVGNNTISEISEICGIYAYEYYQFLVEAMHEQYPVTGGVMPWIFKRPWTNAGIQLVDGLGDPIAPFYAVKNAYKPLSIHISLKELVYAKGETVELDARIINDSNLERKVTAKIEVFDPQLKCIFEADHDICVEADAYQTKLQTHMFTIPDSYNDKFFFLRASLYEDDIEISQSFYWPVVISAMEDETFRNERRTNKKTDELEHKNGPWLKNQIADTTALLDFFVDDVCRKGDRIYGTVTVINKLNTPAFPVHIQIDNDGMVQYLDDDWFFLSGNSKKRIHFTVRCESETDEKLKIILSAWNCKQKEISV